MHGGSSIAPGIHAGPDNCSGMLYIGVARTRCFEEGCML